MKRLACSGLSSLVTAAWAALGALVWTGCSSSFQAHASGDVYCDQTGCYQCDGYNCTAVSGGGASTGNQATSDSGPASVTTVTTVNDASAVDDAEASPPDSAPPPECVTSEDCRADVPQICIGGYCRYTCATSEQCALIDARLDVCNATDAAPGYCVSSGAE
jgi:hypothetical protein